MAHEKIIQNAEEIAKIYHEVAEKFDSKQISASCDIKFRKYADKIDELSDYHCHLNRYLSNTNIESGRYKISLIFEDIDDRNEVYKYYEELQSEADDTP